MNSDVHLNSTWCLISCPRQTNAVSSIHIPRPVWGRRQGDAEHLQGYSGYGQNLPSFAGSTEQTFPEKIPSVHEISVCVCVRVYEYVCVHIRCPFISPGVMQTCHAGINSLLIENT